MNIKTSFLILFLLTCESSYSQGDSLRQIDSLSQVLKKPLTDTQKVETLIALAEAYYTNAPSKAMAFCFEAKNLSEKINFQDGLANSYGWLAFLYEQEGKIPQALEYNYKALAISRKAKNKKDEGTILNNIAAIYKNQGKIIEALEFHQRSLKLKKEIGDKGGISSSYNNIGLIYAGQGRIADALEYYSRSLKIEEDLNNADEFRLRS
ncbi:MAG: tetratricopeptide repeat protein [Flavobacterium sp.]|nr:MAG: tetratricopeptide repeat protein [Flavobacterium sp.]